jgi:hypothetical protein
MIINSSNKSDYGLVFDKQNKASVYAANELNKYLKRCCNFTLSDYQNQKHFISIGISDITKDFIDKLDKSALKESGLYIAFNDGNIYIYGGSDKGVIYGTYEFLERYLGVKFLTATDEVTPKSDFISIEEKDVLLNPCFPQRECAHFSFMVNPDYVLKRRFEGPNTPDNEKAGIINKTWFDKISNSHNSHEYVDRSKYLKTHPEMFNTPDPEKKSKFTALDDIGQTECCYSNGLTDDGKVDETLSVSVVKAIADSLYKFIVENPDKKYFMFGRQDNGGAICYCKRCVEKRKKYGGEAGTMIIMLNAVIDLVEKRLEKEGRKSDFILVTFAYQSTLQAPVDANLKPIDELVIPRERLHIRYAPLLANYSYSYIDPRQDKKIRDSIYGWTNLTKNIMLWDYPVNYIDKYYFAPAYLYLSDNMKFYNKVGFSYVMYEEAYGGTHGYHIEMDSYVISKLFWNPELDVYALMKEYIDGYYQIAGEEVYAFRCKMLDFYKKNFADKGLFIGPCEPWCDFLYPENYPISLLTECVDILDSGIKKIENSLLTASEKYVLIKRVKTVLLTPLRMISRNDEYYFGDKKSDYYRRFISLMVELGHSIPWTPHRIMEKSVPNYKILVNKNDPKHLEAVEYFNEWIKNKSGVFLSVVDQYEVYPTYAEKVISIGENDFAKEFFKRTDFSKYNVFVRSCGSAVFIAGKDLKAGCDILLSNLKDTPSMDVSRRFMSLESDFIDEIEYVM